jgi:putative ABC transport system permease protein
LERTREIGIRRALGARRREILVQFLFEALALSLLGGFLGILLGVILSLIIDGIAEFKTDITLFSVVIAFSIAGAVGVGFGTFPAKRAAELNPIESLRYE